MKRSGRERYFQDDVTMPNESGKGFKIGSWDNAVSRFGWREVYEQVSLRGTAAGTSPLTYTDPTWTIFGATSFYGYVFIVGDQVWQSFKVPHDVLPGTPIHFVANWAPGAISSPLDAGYVTWEFEYAYALGSNQAAFDFGHATSPLTNSGTVTCTGQLGSVAYQHMSTKTAAVTLPALTEPGGVIHTRVKRIDNATSPLANAAEDIFLLATGFQYKSTNVPTYQKDPAFYTL